jgi:hypothetical protein
MSRQTWWIVGGLGCGVVAMLGIVLCGGGGYLLYRSMSASQAEISADMDRLFAAAHEGKFADTYQTSTTPEFQKVMNADQYRQMGEMFARLGALKSKTSGRFNMSQRNAETTADVSYNAQFERGPATITARLRRVEGRWKLVNLNVNSPVFMKDIATLICPHCQGAYSPGAKFCPHCGKEVPEKPIEKPAETP